MGLPANENSNCSGVVRDASLPACIEWIAGLSIIYGFAWVVGREEVEILRERALMFLAAARDDLRAGRVAAFHAEQACQLALKYVLASRAGYYPHTHSLRRLFEEVRAVKPELWSLYERYMFAFEVMEDAYLGARYLPRRYSRDVAEHLVKVAEELVALCT